MGSINWQFGAFGDNQTQQESILLFVLKLNVATGWE